MSQRQSFTEFIKCLLIKQLLKSLHLLRESGAGVVSGLVVGAAEQTAAAHAD